MPGTHCREFGSIAQRGRRAARAFRPQGLASTLEIRLLPATLSLSPTSLPNDTLGHAYNQTVTASGGTAPYTYTVTSGALPGGLSLDSTTGAITGTPNAANTFNFTIGATDGSSDAGSQAYTVTINPAIAFTTTTLPAATVGANYSQQLASTGGTGTVTYSVTSGSLPAGLNLSTAGLISGTATTAGPATFTITATDTVGATTGQSFTETVNPTVTFTTTTLPAATVGTSYSQQIATSGGTAPLTFALTSGSLPSGLSLSSAGLISGTATTAGPATFTVTATDANNSASSHSYTLSVNPTIAFTTTTLPGATVGTAYSQQLATTGGTAPLSFAVTTGSLPAGLALSSAGLISGTPTAAGSSSFTVTATDTNGATAAQAYTLDVSSSSSATTTGPTVTSLKRYGFHAQPTIFKLTFSSALDPTSAQNVSNYTLVPLVNGQAGTPIAIASAAYDSTTNTVTLTPVHNVYLFAQYQLTVNGTSPSGIKDTSGNFLAGANGVSGTNYVKQFGKEILSGPNIPSGTPTALANFINNEWNHELASKFAALAAAAGDTTAAAATPARAVATPAVKTAARLSHAAAMATVPVTPTSAATSAALAAVRPATVDALLAAIVPQETEKKK